MPDDEVGTIEGQGIMVSCSTKTVNVDGNVIQEEDIQESGDRPGQEEKPEDPEDPNNPGQEGKITFTSETLANENGNVLDNTPNNADDFGEGKKAAKIHIHSEDPITSFKVKIDSETLTASVLGGVGLAPEFDLADPIVTVDGEKKDLTTGLKSLEFPVGDEVKGATDLDFDITQFVPLTTIYGAANHRFILTVTDNAGNSKTLTLLIVS